MTYSVIIEGIKWAFGLTEYQAECEVEYLTDVFVSPQITIRPE